MAENPADVASTVMQFSLMQSLKTGNPILDMMLSCVLLSILGYVLTNFTAKKDQLLRWLTKLFVAPAKGELKFFGEEYHDTWGDVHRRYPQTFRAILHHIDVNKCEGVNAYEEIQTQNQRRWGDKKKKNSLVTYMPNVDECFELDKDVLCERYVEEENDQNKKSNKHKARTITLRVYSKNKNVDELKSYVSQLITNYETFMKNEVDKSQFYFITKMESIDDKSTLMYDQFEFVSTRSFDNIFFNQKAEMVRRLDFFLKNKAWYQKRGVPYTLGFMFFGPPGTGKTSTIKAIANYTRRHIVEISLSRIKTYKDLQKVFHETNFCDKQIPHDKMIYILEDIDCLDDIVKARDDGFEETKEKKKKKKTKKEGEGEGKEGEKSGSGSSSSEEEENNDEEDEISKNLNKAMKMEYEFFKKQMKSWQKDPLTLSHILNILDGLLECHGRILIITTNHPEKLDAALIRPGRVDMKVHFSWCSQQDTIEIVEMFYETKIPKAKTQHLISNKFTAAEVYQICFQSQTMDVALSQLLDTTAKNTLSLSTQLSKSKKAPKKKRRAISGASSSEEEADGSHHAHGHGQKKRYLAKSVNLSFNHF